MKEKEYVGLVVTCFLGLAAPAQSQLHEPPGQEISTGSTAETSSPSSSQLPADATPTAFPPDAQFDQSIPPVNLSGVVSAVNWDGPQAWIAVEIAEGSEQGTTWLLGLGNPRGLVRRGLRAESIGVGEEISVWAHAATDGSNVGKVKKLTTAEGQEFLF